MIAIKRQKMCSYIKFDILMGVYEADIFSDYLDTKYLYDIFTSKNVQ